MTRPEAIEAIVLATSTNETKAKGRVRKVTFEIPAEGNNPFEGLGGERIHIVVVRLNNDETVIEPVEEPKPTSEEAKDRQRFHEKPATAQIAMACNRDSFREYIRLFHCAGLADNAAACDAWVKDLLEVESKREVTPGSKAFGEWVELYGNYLAWLKYERAA